jgi:hypothetical protein
MSCCNENGCTRTTPITFYIGPWSDEVYAVTKSRLVSDHGNGRATFAAVIRHEVTDSMRRFVLENREWVERMFAALDDLDREEAEGDSGGVREEAGKKPGRLGEDSAGM